MAKADERVAEAVAPWARAVAALERWRRESRARRPDEKTVAELSEQLQALVRGQTTVPSRMPLAGDPLSRSFATPTMAATLAAWRARRSALLRLAVWSALNTLRTAYPEAPQGAALFAKLQEQMAGAVPRVPPGLSPAFESAAGGKAQQFFGGRLLDALKQLAARHPAHSLWLERLHATHHGEPTIAAAQAWSEAWSVGIAANYLNCLEHKSKGQLDDAMRRLWRDKSTRMHTADGLLLLPARERHLHLDLWTDFVQAQALDHQPGRFQAPAAWHCVPLKMHDLRVHEQVEDGWAVRFDRGIGVDQLHLPVFADRARLALEAMTTPSAAAAAPKEETIDIDLPDLAPGQAANLRLVLRRAGATGADGKDPPRRPFPCAPAPMLDEQQRDIYRRWAERDGGLACELGAGELQWRSASGAAGLDGMPSCDLGSAALWRATRHDGQVPQWIDVAMVVRQSGRWDERAVEVFADVVDGELHCGLRLDEDDRPSAKAAAGGPDLATAAEAAALRHALNDPARCFWAGTQAGAGALVMVGVDLDGAGKGHGG